MSRDRRHPGEVCRERGERWSRRHPHSVPEPMALCQAGGDADACAARAAHRLGPCCRCGRRASMRACAMPPLRYAGCAAGTVPATDRPARGGRYPRAPSPPRWPPTWSCSPARTRCAAPRACKRCAGAADKRCFAVGDGTGARWRGVLAWTHKRPSGWTARACSPCPPCNGCAGCASAWSPESAAATASHRPCRVRGARCCARDVYARLDRRIPAHAGTRLPGRWRPGSATGWRWSSGDALQACFAQCPPDAREGFARAAGGRCQRAAGGDRTRSRFRAGARGEQRPPGRARRRRARGLRLASARGRSFPSPTRRLARRQPVAAGPGAAFALAAGGWAWQHWQQAQARASAAADARQSAMAARSTHCARGAARRRNACNRPKPPTACCATNCSASASARPCWRTAYAARRPDRHGAQALRLDELNYCWRSASNACGSTRRRGRCASRARAGGPAARRHRRSCLPQPAADPGAGTGGTRSARARIHGCVRPPCWRASNAGCRHPRPRSPPPAIRNVPWYARLLDRVVTVQPTASAGLRAGTDREAAFAAAQGGHRWRARRDRAP